MVPLLECVLGYLIIAIIWSTLAVLGYIGDFEYVNDHRAGKTMVELNGRLNKCGVISPHFDVGVKEIEGWTISYFPQDSKLKLKLSTQSP
ncbi:40S ribosomal protein S15a [Spatholobus suberectus]|nr:40S ribosomal protein S15a [Spatholobus suberectus]